MFAIVVYEQSISIFNAQTGDLLDEKGRLEASFSNPTLYASCNNNPMGTDLILGANKASGKKPVCFVYGLNEIPYKDQIDDLLIMGRVEEAREIFNVKEP
jgi:hypothetical protein